MSFAKFDAMRDFAQSEFIADMVDETEAALIAENNSDWADKIDVLFNTIEPGDAMSLGLVELERNVARARVFDLQKVEKEPEARRLNVEDALFVTLKKNGMELSSNTMTTVVDRLANFHPLTLAQFVAKSEAEQRHIVRLAAAIGYPDAMFRDEVKARAEGPPEDEKPDVKSGLTEVMRDQFPARTDDQPGFSAFASTIEAESKKTPDDPGILYQFTLYLLTAADQKIRGHMHEMDEETVVLPDGRSVFEDNSGDYWAVAHGDATNAQKLEGDQRNLAIKLGDCKFRRGIKRGADALAACWSEVGLGDAEIGATQPKPDATPPPQDDDPIGNGGFITPPDKPSHSPN